MHSYFVTSLKKDIPVTISVAGKPDKVLENAKGIDLGKEYTKAELANCIALRQAIKDGDIKVTDENGQAIR